MKSLQDILKKKSTKKLNLKSPKTTPFDKAKINGVSGNFILDTGASNSCVGFESIELFLLTAEASRQKASVQEPQECLHKLHQIIITTWNLERFIIRFSDFDLSHVNEA
jgi:hypothetical protein